MTQLSKNIIYNLIGQGLILLLTFISVRYIFKQLGEDVFGIIYFTLTMNAVVYSVLDMGISSTAVREVSANFIDEPFYIKNFIKTASLFYWIIYGILAIVIYFTAPLLVEKWIILKTINLNIATHLIRVLGISAILILPQRFYASLIRGLQRMEFTNIIDVTVLGLQQLGIIIILILNGSVFLVIYWIAFSYVVNILIYLFTIQHFFSFNSIILGYSSKVIKRNVKYSWNMMLISGLSMVQMQSDKVILSKLISVGTLGFYGFAYTLTARVSIITEAIAQAVFPYFSNIFKAGAHSLMKLQYRKLQDLVLLITLPLFAAIPFATIPLFTYVFNQEIAKMLLLPITLLSFGFYMHGTLVVPYFFSLAVGRPEISTKANILALFCVLPVTIVLIYFFGLTGAGLSWVFYNLFSYIYTIPRICKFCISIPKIEWYTHTFKILIIGSLTYCIAWTFPGYIYTQSLLILTVSYMSGSIIFLFALYWLISKELKTVLKNHIHNLRYKLL